jgi:hypothetical protein
LTGNRQRRLSTVSTRQKNVREVMEAGLDVTDSFLTGSYQRSTGCKRLRYNCFNSGTSSLLAGRPTATDRHALGLPRQFLSDRVPAQLLRLPCDINSIEARSVLAQDFALYLQCQIRMIFLL